MTENNAAKLSSQIGAAVGQELADANPDIAPSDFYAVLPQHRYLYIPTRDLWPAASIVGKLGKDARKDLDVDRAVVQMTWHPNEPLIIEDRIVADGGWVPHPGVRVGNLYRGPNPINGDAAQAGMWREHLRLIYPDDADHIERWLAHRVQRPGVKINHALVLGGAQGIGKDTLLEPVKFAVGPWNWSEISPTQMLGRFNGWGEVRGRSRERRPRPGRRGSLRVLRSLQGVHRRATRRAPG